MPNRFNGSIKEMILGALKDVGGREYLARQAEQNPVAFLGLVGRVLPMQQLEGTDAASITFLHLVAARAFSEQLNGHAVIEGAATTVDTDNTSVSTPPNLMEPATE